MTPPRPAAQTIDARGRYCPMPTLLATLALERMTSGEILEVTADDPTTRRDLPQWCVEAGHRLLGFTEQPPAFVARIQKA